MKQFTCFNSARKITDAARHAGLGKPVTLLIWSLLIGSLLAVGCSKEKSRTASSETQTSSKQTNLNQSAMSNPSGSALPETPAPLPAPKKKMAKKWPATVTYSDQAYGVSFRYPRKYALKNGEHSDSGSVPVNFVQPGGVTAVSVELPKGLYPGTDVVSAFFRASVNKSLTAAECGQFALPQSVASDKDALQPSNIALGGLELREVEDVSGEETSQVDTKYYHVFENGACYEFALSLSTEKGGSEEAVTPVDREKVFRRLETILATVKIKAEPTPQVVAGPAAAPTAQDTEVR